MGSVFVFLEVAGFWVGIDRGLGGRIDLVLFLFVWF